MNIQARLYRLENNHSQEPNTGLPLRPDGLSDEQYQQAIEDKRAELGLAPNQPIPILALTGITSGLPQ